ncbi:MAG: toxic anion resistance protein, partial [Sphingobacteriales bacterium]
MENSATSVSMPTVIDKDANVNLEVISETDKQRLLALGQALNPADTNSILNYGADVQNSMEKYSNEFLSSVRTFNSGEVGGLINELLTELNYIDVDELNQSPLKQLLSKIPLLNKLVVDAGKLFQKYDTVVGNVDKITNKIKAGRINSIKDNASLQTMFDSNVAYIKQMEDLIVSGVLKHRELSEKLVGMEADAARYNDYEIADLREYINRLDRRLADMKVVRMIMLQSLAQIRLVQNNNNA